MLQEILREKRIKNDPFNNQEDVIPNSVAVLV